MPAHFLYDSVRLLHGQLTFVYPTYQHKWVGLGPNPMGSKPKIGSEHFLELRTSFRSGLSVQCLELSTPIHQLGGHMRNGQCCLCVLGSLSECSEVTIFKGKLRPTLALGWSMLTLHGPVPVGECGDGSRWRLVPNTLLCTKKNEEKQQPSQTSSSVPCWLRKENTSMRKMFLQAYTCLLESVSCCVKLQACTMTQTYKKLLLFLKKW